MIRRILPISSAEENFRLKPIVLHIDVLHSLQKGVAGPLTLTLTPQVKQ